MAETILEADAITKIYNIGGKKVEILRGVSLEVKRGEFVVIAGSSGSGKTTLLSVLSGLDRPDSGNVVLCGRDITNLTENELAPVRNELTGFVFQAFHLIPSLNALENVMFPAELRKDRNARSRAEALLGQVGLSQRLINFPEQLSGGEQQRVAICRALVNGPEIIFADEPTGNLDSVNSQAIIELLVSLYKKNNMTLVVATHSRSLADRADRVIRLHDGSILSGSYGG
jgi:putative ABC transport system ATP-binding protein